MLTNVILAILVVEGAVGIGIAYKSLKTSRKLKTMVCEIDTKAHGIKEQIKQSDKKAAKEISNQIHNLSFMGIKVR